MRSAKELVAHLRRRQRLSDAAAAMSDDMMAHLSPDTLLKDAADYIERTAPSADGPEYETTAEERAHWAGVLATGPNWLTGEQSARLLRDLAKAIEASVIDRAFAASETKRADEAGSELARLASMKEAGDIAVEEEANKRIKAAEAERDREAAARREAVARRDEASRQRDEYLTRVVEAEARAEQAEAENATLRAALVEADAAVDNSYQLAQAEFQHHDRRADNYDMLIRAWRERRRAALATTSTGEGS